jgi:hypothetical protein
MPLGFPLRTRKTIVELKGELSCGKRLRQLAGINPLAATASTSVT